MRNTMIHITSKRETKHEHVSELEVSGSAISIPRPFPPDNSYFHFNDCLLHDAA